MLKFFFLLACLSLFAVPAFSQNYFGGTAAFEWSAYQRYQRPNNTPFAKQSNQHNSAGSILNVLPNLRLGVYSRIQGRGYSHYRIVLDAGIQFHPYSFDMNDNKGLGALSIPVLLSFSWITHGELFFSLGGGVQYSKMEFFQSKTNPYKDIYNPFFMTYIAEFNFGRDFDYYVYGSFTAYIRLGFNQYQSQTLDVGIRFRIYTP
jgi:hypothetical protein